MKNTVREFQLIKIFPNWFLIFWAIVSLSGVIWSKHLYQSLACLIFLISLLLEPIFYKRSKIFVCDGRIIIKYLFRPDQLYFIADLLEIEKEYYVGLNIFNVYYNFYLKNGKHFSLPPIRDAYGLIEIVKSVNPNIKIKGI